MIYVVDDAVDGADILCRLLHILGYPATAIYGGREALAAVRSHPPESPLLLVLDEMMPGLSGMETLEQLRADPRIAHTPVVFFSASISMEKREEAMTLGALDWLIKGADVDLAINSITHLYEHVGGAKTSAGRHLPD